MQLNVIPRISLFWVGIPLQSYGDALGVTLIVENGFGDPNSSSGRGCLHFAVFIPLRKVCAQLFFLQLWVNSRAD